MPKFDEEYDPGETVSRAAPVGAPEVEQLPHVEAVKILLAGCLIEAMQLVRDTPFNAYHSWRNGDRDARDTVTRWQDDRDRLEQRIAALLGGVV